MANSNIQGELIFPDERYVEYIPKVTETVPVDNTGAVNKDSLFDPLIFGVPGSDARMRNLGCIDLHAELIHPFVTVYLDEISTLYTSVIEGKIKVKLVKGELIPHPMGDTGYTYFLSIIDKLKFPEKESKTREQGRQVVLKYQKQGKLTNSYLIVIAAGLRELVIDDGRVTSDEINDIYIRIMNSASIVKMLKTDSAILHLHNILKELYKHIMSLISGKKKAMNAHLARNYTYGSRNVITGQVLNFKRFQDIPLDIVDRFTIGLNQYLKNIEPIVTHYVNEVFYNNSVEIGRAFVNGVSKPVSITANAHKKFNITTVTKLIEEMQLPAFRHTPVLIDGNPMGYTHTTDTTVDIYLPNTVDDMGEYAVPPKEAHPMTYAEMFFTAIGDAPDKTGITATRYPVANANSAVVGRTVLETTIKKDKVYKQHVHVKVTNGKDFITESFPVLGEDWQESFVIPFFRLTGYGADFDGDGLSSGNLMTEEANKNINDVLNDIAYYKPFDLDISNKPNEFAMLTLTKD